VLAVYTPNSIDMSTVVWGTLYAGGIVSPVNPAYTAEELAFQLKNSGAKALATQLPLIETAVKAARKVGLPKYRIFLLGDGEDPTSRYPHFTSLKSTPGRFSYGRVKVRNPSKELAFLAYSSGTTGLPKGVMLTHRNLVSNILMTVAGDHTMQSSEKVLAFLPLFHIYGLTRLLHWTFYSGLTCIVMEKFDLEEWCKLIQQHKITYGYVVPPVILALSKHPAVDEYDLSSVRALTSAAAPLTKELIRTAYKRLGIPIKQGYGLSETSPSVHMQPLELWESAIGSVGTLLPNQTAKYVSHSGHEVPIGEAGELRVKGPNIFAGYWKNAEETKTALTPDGFLKTGDVGYQDKDGNFYITDRIKELIKYKGFQVAPAELEGILMSHDKINDVAVLGVQRDDLATEVPLACVVPSPGVPIGHELEKEITAFLASKVANHKKLRGGVKFVDEIPKSAAGKILRRILKEKYQQAPEMGTSKDKQGLGGWILVEQDEFSAQRPSKALQWSTDSVISKSLKLLTQRASEAWVELSLRM
jgi:4-coumarate--CoA ligase